MCRKVDLGSKMKIFANTHPLFSDLGPVPSGKKGEIRSKGRTLQNLHFSQIKVEHSKI